MKVAVLSLTRDRLDYTKHCFATLAENAGCEYDHYVLDQGSTDGTREWLDGWFRSADEFRARIALDENVGISAGINKLIAWIHYTGLGPYDVIVKIDNDCEIVTPLTLRDICALVDTYGLILSPQILGLRQPPATLGTPLSLGGTLVDEKAQVGGIFLAAPASLYDEFRYSEGNPVWGGDDVEVCAWWRARGGRCGYVQGYEAWHFEGTDGQHERFPEYFRRVEAEGKVLA